MWSHVCVWPSVFDPQCLFMSVFDPQRLTPSVFDPQCLFMSVFDPQCLTLSVYSCQCLVMSVVQLYVQYMFVLPSCPFCHHVPVSVPSLCALSLSLCLSCVLSLCPLSLSALSLCPLCLCALSLPVPPLFLWHNFYVFTGNFSLSDFPEVKAWAESCFAGSVLLFFPETLYTCVYNITLQASDCGIIYDLTASCLKTYSTYLCSIYNVSMHRTVYNTHCLW